ncbi:MAG TPA: hypothetical protein VFP06_02775, partial [Acidimicrobiales bacterium]|nr:hypothetical protein [Acidimicrobiales bacterium]
LTTVVGSAAGAGGADWLEPARDRYEPGPQVTMIGYGYGLVAGYREAVQREGPFHAYLHGPVDDFGEYVGPAPAQGGGLTVPGPRPGVRVGPVTVEEGVPGQMWQGVRVSITFRLPDDLASGMYWVAVCSEGCRANLGEFADSPVHVGVDPPQPVVRHWPLTDPAIRWLDDGALLMDEHGRVLTAADVRAGRVPPPPAAVAAPAADDPPAPEAGRAAAPGTGGDARPDGERRDAGARAGGDGGAGADAGDPVATVATAGDRAAGDAALDPASWAAAAVAALVATVAVAVWRRRAGRGARPGPGDGRGGDDGDGGGGTGGGGDGPHPDPLRRIAVRTGDGFPGDAPGGELTAGPAPDHPAEPDEVLVGASAAGRRPGRRARATL